MRFVPLHAWINWGRTRIFIGFYYFAFTLGEIGRLIDEVVVLLIVWFNIFKNKNYSENGRLTVKEKDILELVSTCCRRRRDLEICIYRCHYSDLDKSWLFVLLYVRIDIDTIVDSGIIYVLPLAVVPRVGNMSSQMSLFRETYRKDIGTGTCCRRDLEICRHRCHYSDMGWDNRHLFLHNEVLWILCNIGTHSFPATWWKLW